MAIYALTADPNAIDFGHAALQARLVDALGAAVAVYRPYPFVEHSGFSETVREEIGMVLANHPAGEPPARAFDPFVSAWSLEEHLDRRVLALSGGWRKYLGLALFLNRPLPRRLLFDATSHLSDTRMGTVLTRASEQGDAIFCEYDPDLLLQLQARTSLPLPPLRLLADDGTTIREVSPR